MSQETKEQLQRQIDEELSTITACQSRAADLRKALSLIKDKPEPRHGDYGIHPFGDCSVLIARGNEHVKYELWAIGCRGEMQGDPKEKKIIGNIFDDLKAAGPGGALIPMSRDEMKAHLKTAGYDGYREVDERIEAKLK